MTQDNLKIGQLVYVISKDIFVRIIDKEYINDVMLYYTNDNSAYIIDNLYYVKPHNPEGEINKQISSLLDEWLTPDNCLEISVRLMKKINKPFR